METPTWLGRVVPILGGVPRTRAAVPAPTPVESYLAELSRALSGPRRRKADLMAEAHDHLVDATEAFEADGLSRLDAEREAVHDFGDLRDVVPGYRAELGIAQGRRTAVMLCLVLLAQPIVWQEGVWAWTQHPETANAFAALMNQLVMVVGMLAIMRRRTGPRRDRSGAALPGGAGPRDPSHGDLRADQLRAGRRDLDLPGRLEQRAPRLHPRRPVGGRRLRTASAEPGHPLGPPLSPSDARLSQPVRLVTQVVRGFSTPSMTVRKVSQSPLPVASIFCPADVSWYVRRLRPPTVLHSLAR